MSNDAGVVDDHLAGAGRRPGDSTGYGSPAFEPKPASCSRPYSSRRVRRVPKRTMPTLLENLMTSRSESALARCTSVIVRPSSFHRPPKTSMISSARARLSSSNVAATNGLSVDPGS